MKFAKFYIEKVILKGIIYIFLNAFFLLLCSKKLVSKYISHVLEISLKNLISEIKLWKSCFRNYVPKVEKAFSRKFP